jgi:outer membrane protein assembly factor BamD (BamD/ComL family)
MRAANQKLRVGVVLTVIAAHCVTILPHRAEEQSGSNSAAAQALFDSAHALMKTDNYAEACPKLEERQRLDPGSGTVVPQAQLGLVGASSAMAPPTTFV